MEEHHYKESQHTRELKSEIAENKPRDEEGHFIKEEQNSNPSGSVNPSFFNKLFANASVSKTTDNDTLIDVHVDNPLHKIIELLKDIKKQKAFSFSIKGTLGIAGIAVVIAGAGAGIPGFGLSGIKRLYPTNMQLHKPS